ncbi:uncharacterized protein [Clytia hemisphaerica]|uniref:Apple domain-containing protein n=1 Tax=Clytia hemisphaerica TaxID=252671 RepID=A0A7M5V1E7_9CNID
MSPKLIFVILILIQASSNNGRIVRNKIIESPNGTKIKIQYIVMTGFNNKKLQGPTSIQTTMVKSVSHCKAECIRVNSCISFNIFPAGSFFDCQLFDTDHYIDQQILTDQTGYQYFVIKSNCSVGDPNLKCPNEFTYCKPNYDTDTSTCECRFPGCLDPVVYTCTPGPTINDTDAYELSSGITEIGTTSSGCPQYTLKFKFMMTAIYSSAYSKVLSVVDAGSNSEWISFRVDRSLRSLLTGLRGVGGSQTIVEPYQANVEYVIIVTSYKEADGVVL